MNAKKRSGKERRGTKSRWVVLAAAGTELSVIVAGSIWIGDKADKLFLFNYTKLPVGLMIAVPFGFILGLANLLRILRWVNSEDDE